MLQRIEVSFFLRVRAQAQLKNPTSGQTAAPGLYLKAEKPNFKPPILSFSHIIIPV